MHFTGQNYPPSIGLIKLYAPKRCDTFFEYSMEYSILKNFVIVSLFFLYSYSKIFDIFVVAVVFWNIPYSKHLRNIPKYSMFQKQSNIFVARIFHIPKKIKYRCCIEFLEYSIFRKTGFNVVDQFFWNIPFC